MHTENVTLALGRRDSTVYDRIKIRPLFPALLLRELGGSTLIGLDTHIRECFLPPSYRAHICKPPLNGYGSHTEEPREDDLGGGGRIRAGGGLEPCKLGAWHGRVPPSVFHRGPWARSPHLNNSSSCPRACATMHLTSPEAWYPEPNNFVTSSSSASSAGGERLRERERAGALPFLPIR